jgi:hypothetical protein
MVQLLKSVPTSHTHSILYTVLDSNTSHVVCSDIYDLYLYNIFYSLLKRRIKCCLNFKSRTALVFLLFSASNFTWIPCCCYSHFKFHMDTVLLLFIVRNEEVQNGVVSSGMLLIPRLMKIRQLFKIWEGGEAAISLSLKTQSI